MTVAELEVILDAQSGQLTEQQAIDFRNSYFNEPTYPTEAWSLSLWALSPKIDLTNIQPIFWYTIKKAVICWLLSDNNQSDIDLEWDVVSKADGDKVERNLRLNPDLSQALKNELLIEIGLAAFRIDSSKLQTAINTANGI